MNALMLTVKGPWTVWGTAISMCQIEIRERLPMRDETGALEFMILTGGIFARQCGPACRRTTPRWYA